MCPGLGGMDHLVGDLVSVNASSQSRGKDDFEHGFQPIFEKCQSTDVTIHVGEYAQVADIFPDVVGTRFRIG